MFKTVVIKIKIGDEDDQNKLVMTEIGGHDWNFDNNQNKFVTEIFESDWKKFIETENSGSWRIFQR